MKTQFAVALVMAMLSLATGCGMAESLVGTITASSGPGTVSDLWSDVPRMDGMDKADIGLPLAAQVAFKAMTHGEFQFIAYTTDAAPQAVVDFYSDDRMQAAGWSAQDAGGCSTSTNSSSICAFGQGAGPKQDLLLIFTSQDSSSKQTDVFFARVYSSPTPTPAK